MGKINVAVAGVGNCASSLIQGVHYYREAREDQFVPGLMHVNFGGYHIRDIKFVAAFDVDANKVGKDLAEAIFTPPNCTIKFSDVPKLGVEVMKGPVLDGLGKYLRAVIPVDATQEPVDVAKVLEESDADLLINYLPVGSYQASRYYAEQAIKAGCGFINCIPEFIVSGKEWGERFKKAGLPCAGDDIKSQVGATILHRTLAKLLIDRGVKLEESYQLNIGGNSVTGDEEILLEVDGVLNRVRIGDFVDQMMEKYPVDIRRGKEVLETSTMRENIRCFTITDDYRQVLAPVTKLIRHKIFEPILEVTLAEGHKIKITQDHNLFTIDDNGDLKPIPGKELKPHRTFVIIPSKLVNEGEEVSTMDLSSYLNDSGAVKAEGVFLSIHSHPEISIPIDFPVTNEFSQVIDPWLADRSFDGEDSFANVEIGACNYPKYFIKRQKNAEIRKVAASKGFNKFLIPKIRLIKEAGIKPTTTHQSSTIEGRIILSQLDRVKDERVREKLRKLCLGDIRFVKVKEVRKLSAEPRYVYDLSVPSYERFICSNILVHNTDFLNMLEEERLSSKRISKTEAVASQVPYEVPLRIGPSDYVPFLKDNKVCYIYMRGRKFGDIPLTIDVKLSVEDSPNSAGVVIDAIRAVKLALNRGISGPLVGVSAYFFKHPPVQMTDAEAKKAVEDFINGKGA